MPNEPVSVDVVTPGGSAAPSSGVNHMAASERAAESMEACVVSQAQGHAFCMEQGRLSTLEGKMGYREGLTHRIIGESGGGQARAQLPGGAGGVPTVVKTVP
jgi:hypothetical protein